MSQLAECIIKVFVALATLGVLFALSRTQPNFLTRHRNRVLQGLTLIGALAYINFGGFHTDGTAFHVWDQYHYFIGSKYFPELRYDGLYVATIEARRSSHPELAPPSRIRDLRNGELVPLASVAAHTEEVRKRFSDARWQAFSDDVGHFYLQDDIFLDNGLKATPTHIQVLRLFSTWQPFRTRTMALLTLLDFGLLLAGGIIIYRAFGAPVLAGVSLAFGLGFCSRYYWVGGAFLRHDWFVALLLAAAALKTGRNKLAAIAVAYASAVRIFPVLFVIPLAVHWLAQLRRDGEVRPAAEFSCVFVISLAVLVAIGWAVQPDAWHQSLVGLMNHARTVFPTSIGLRVPFITSVANFRGDFVNPTTLYDYVAISQDYLRMQHENMWLIILVTGAFLGLLFRTAWRASQPVEAFTLGTALVFALTVPTCYYGTYFALLPLVRPLRTTAVFLGATVFCYATGGIVLALSQSGLMRLNGTAVFTPTCVFLGLAMVDWMLHYPVRSSASLVADNASRQPA